MSTKRHISSLPGAKVAVETVIWGDSLPNLQDVFKTLARYGCLGVEFSQRPDRLGDPRVMRDMLREHELTLLGLSGGTLSERVEFCGSFLRPQYLYVEEWNESECNAAIAAGFKLALHPHVFKPVHRMTEAAELLKKHSQLGFLPDTAHFRMVGDSIADAISEWRERLAAIHLKDWIPFYGRSSHRYSRGFVEFGAGIVNFEILFEKLRAIRYSGWFVIEQGRPEASPEEVIAQATTWLGIDTDSGSPTSRFRLVSDSTPQSQTKGFPIPFPEIKRSYDLEEEKQFLRTMFQTATEDIRDCYPRLTQALGALLKPKLILLCACNAPANLMSVLGAYPSDTRIPKNHLSYGGSLSLVSIERQTTTVFDLSLQRPAEAYGRPTAKFGYPTLIKKDGPRFLISVPVLNPKNPHQVRFVVNICLNDRPSEPAIRDYERLSALIAQAADAHLDERCAIAAASVSFWAGQCQQTRAFLEKLLTLIQETTRCEVLTIFLVNDIGDRLEEAQSTGLRWSLHLPLAERFYRPADKNDIVSHVWQRREAMISPSAEIKRGVSPKSDEVGSRNEGSCMCAPMLDATGSVIGVIRCQNKLSEPESFHMFSEDDLAVLDSVCQAAVPHLQVLLSKERRAQALRRLSHELLNPLNSLQGASEQMREELLARYGTSERFFSEDLIGDLEDWIGLMKGLLGNADLFRLTAFKPALELKPVLLFSEVFMPAVKQITTLLKDKDFNPAQIKIAKFDDIPALWLDKKFITQVVFNLLSNAIKYAYDDPGRFEVSIRGRETDAYYEIDCCDSGPGIPAELSEAIFLEGVRAPGAENSNVGGDGLGLWVVKRALQAHDGEVELTQCKNPTTFTIFLPKWRAYRQTKPELPIPLNL